MQAVRSSPRTAAWSSASATDSRFWWKRTAARRAAAQSRLKFICREVRCAPKPPIRRSRPRLQKGQILTLPIAHGEGCYFADERTLDELEAEDRVVLPLRR
jgi:phosphoribosylformylglycinamidine (FGAM) synthase-like amidotransferase family enzyme